MEKAYLDIETSFWGEITVVGIFRPPGELIQIVSPDITVEELLRSLEGIEQLVTYWGHRFDLPLIKRHLGIDLRRLFRSVDLADICHRVGLYGGLKSVEKVLGIPRQTDGLTGADAIVLWHRWRQGDRDALRILLKYNEEDVVNLYLVEKRLRELNCAGKKF